MLPVHRWPDCDTLAGRYAKKRRPGGYGGGRPTRPACRRIAPPCFGRLNLGLPHRVSRRRRTPSPPVGVCYVGRFFCCDIQLSSPPTSTLNPKFKRPNFDIYLSSRKRRTSRRQSFQCLIECGAFPSSAGNVYPRASRRGQFLQRPVRRGLRFILQCKCLQHFRPC